ncbi:glycosyltransferase [Vibrio cyclitrophicus]|uniref:glycosyltransferase n=1 Tax=Vibrio cyclitrophicus TaxID=47951 RepID=UPI0002DABCC3|nr:glycosyltransferase [Vibrio cyclitrophicus]OED89924.1 glycosyl transferase [Vibrio cyclitrophicus ZF30]PMF56456.1 glycosyl transferase [Vibrio cyclitrophicus]PMP56340.1 glycosyl transferase [Vibrio cyclitrophicus]
MIDKKLAVAMSVYRTDNEAHLRKAISSILKQTYTNFDLYIEVDGPVHKDISTLLLGYGSYKNVFVNFNESNKGLAFRLNQIIDKVTKSGCYSFIARMDADDISLPTRFSTQLSFLNENPRISVVGSDVLEISNSGDVVFHKKMDKDHAVIAKKIIKKCPFNHPSVMFKISVFDDGFRYKSELKNTQDYYLWVDLLAAEKEFANISEPLLEFRVNDDFHARRGVKKALNDLRARMYAFKKLDVLNFGNVIHTLLLFFLRISPAFMKKLAYKFLR